MSLSFAGDARAYLDPDSVPHIPKRKSITPLCGLRCSCSVTDANEDLILPAHRISAEGKALEKYQMTVPKGSNIMIDARSLHHNRKLIKVLTNVD